MEPTTQLILAVFTVMGSGVVSTIVTYKLGSKRDSRDLRRMKLEECFKSIDRFTTNLTINYIPFISVLNGKFSWDEANDMLLERDNDGEEEHLPRLEMLSSIYFPELKSFYIELLKVRDDLGSVKSEAMQCYLEQRNPKKVISNYKAVFDELDRVEENFKAALFKLAPR